MALVTPTACLGLDQALMHLLLDRQGIRLQILLNIIEGKSNYVQLRMKVFSIYLFITSFVHFEFVMVYFTVLPTLPV